MNKTIVSRQLMNESGKYSYCPYCESKKDLVPDKIPLPPLWKVVTKYTEYKQDGTSFPYFETIYECKKCRRFMTIEDFMFVYTRKTDGTRWPEPPQRVSL